MSTTRNPQQNPIHAAGQSSTSVRHSKEDALDEREFELLVESAQELGRSPYYYEPDPVMAIYIMGRLGLRRGELVHLREEWIDWRQQMIHIPPHDKCDYGRDGGRCGDCRQLARQRVEHAPADTDLDFETALEWMWVPKTEAAARSIYYGWDPRCEIYLERYFAAEEYTRFEASGSAVGRRVTKAAERTEGVDPDMLSPHNLRATAATHLGARGLSPSGMLQMFGWVDMSTAEVYISRNSGNTARQLDAMKSM